MPQDVAGGTAQQIFGKPRAAIGAHHHHAATQIIGAIQQIFANLGRGHIGCFFHHLGHMAAQMIGQLEFRHAASGTQRQPELA